VHFLRRGVVGEVDAGLDVRYATLLGQAIGSMAVDRDLSRLAVARDGRPQGPILLEGAVQGLRAAGIDVLQLGALPAPLMRFAALELADRSGVMVGESLQPTGWNGMRVMLDGKTIDGEQVRDRLRQLDSDVGNGSIGELISDDTVAARYIDRVAAQVQLERPLKVVVDCANGVCGLIVPRLLEAVGAEVIPLYADVDGHFPNHPPDPTRTDNLNDLRLCVRSFNADLGLAFDSDGERLNLVAGDGTILWPDRILMLLARDLLTRHPGSVVVHDACCSPHLGAWVTDLGGKVVRVGAGPTAVEWALAEHGARLAGTSEGHVFLAQDWASPQDAVFGACRLLEILAADTRDIAEIFGELPVVVNEPPMLLELPARNPESVLEALAEGGDRALLSDEHGAWMVEKDGWAGVGLSEDGEQLWYRVEGADEHAVHRIRQRLAERLRAADRRLILPP
jgi:phosphomannomutase/phosphoglucomutase